jgi:hypothetical protein
LELEEVEVVEPCRDILEVGDRFMPLRAAACVATSAACELMDREPVEEEADVFCSSSRSAKASRWESGFME